MKKRFTLMLIAAFVAVVSFAQQGKWSGVSSRSLTSASASANTPDAFKGKTVKKLAKKATTHRAAADFPIIYEAPEGEVKNYVRSGDATEYSEGQGVYTEQSGSVEIVYAEDGVYIYNIIGTDDNDSYVKGTLSDDGKTITVPLKQNVYYSSYYDAAIMIVVGTLTDKFYYDPSITEVTYKIDGDVISLDLPDTYVLTEIWTDDSSWTGCSEWNTVLTEFHEDLTLVTPPDGLAIKTLPLNGSKGYYANDDDDNMIVEEYTSTAEFGFDGTDAYIFLSIPGVPEGWIKGSVNEDGDLQFAPQFFGYNGIGEKYFIGAFGKSGLDDIVFEYDAEAGTLFCPSYIVFSPTVLSADDFYSVSAGTFIGTMPTLVTPPTDLVTVEKAFEGTVNADDESEDFSGTALVGYDGNDVYIQGIMYDMPDAWIKGTWADEDKTSIVIPAGQYIGKDPYGGLVFVAGYNGEGLDDITFKYDNTEDAFTLDQYLLVTSSAKTIAIYYYYDYLVVGINPDVTWAADDMGVSRGDVVSEVTFAEGITGVFAKGEGSSDPKYYTATEGDTAAGHPDGTVRMYAGNTLTITSAEPLGKIVLHLYSQKDNQMQIELAEDADGEFNLDGYKGTWEGNATSITFCVPNESGVQGRITGIDFYYLDYSTVTVEVPEDLQTEAYYFTGTYTDEEDSETETFEVLVGFDGNEVYFQGLSQYIPDAWVKGTMVDGKVTIPGWGLGTYESWVGDYELAFSGAEFTYDAATSTFTCKDGYVSYIIGEDNICDDYMDITLRKIVEKAVKPANPEIVDFKALNTAYPRINLSIPTLDVNGDPMISAKLFYQLFIEKGNEIAPLVFSKDLYDELDEDMSEIPYTFNDDWDIYTGGDYVYLNQDVEEILSWDKIGVQSIYYGGGAINKSDIVWFDVHQYYVDGVETVATDRDAASVSYFDLQGRRATSATRGIVIKQVRHSNGQVTRTKILR